MPIGFQAGLRLVDWVLSGASIDLDFANNRYFGSSGGSVTSYFSITRASNGYAQNSSGVWIPFSSNTLRTTDKGLLIEDARTNYLLQSETPATQTTASLATGNYTLWVEGSGSALASAGSATITGAASATAGSPNTFNITVTGTVTVTVTGSLTRFQLEAGSFASSLIPTTGTSATRAADSVTTISSADTILKSNTNTAFMNVIETGPVDYGTLLDSFSGLQTLIMVRYAGHPTWANVTWSGGLNQTSIAGSGDITTGMKIATAIDHAVGASICANNGTLASQAQATTFSGSTTAWNVGQQSGGGFHFFGYIRRLAIWNTRLPDATLQALTT